MALNPFSEHVGKAFIVKFHEQDARKNPLRSSWHGFVQSLRSTGLTFWDDMDADGKHRIHIMPKNHGIVVFILVFVPGRSDAMPETCTLWIPGITTGYEDHGYKLVSDVGLGKEVTFTSDAVLEEIDRMVNVFKEKPEPFPSDW